MVQDLDLFVGLAEIAGVFVGFAALISFTRRTEVAAFQLAQIRGVVSIGLLVIVAALLPVALGRYGVGERTLWFVCSLAFLLLLWGVMILGFRRPENRQLMISQARTSPVMTAVFWLLLEASIQVPLILAVLGLFPDLEPAFYTTALVVHLFEGAFVLAQLVYSQVSPRQA